MPTKSQDSSPPRRRSPLWLRATAATLLATMTACSTGDLSATSGDKSAADDERAASEPLAGTSSAVTALPVASAPVSATLPAASLDRAAYLTAAIEAGNPRLDILAGVALKLAASPPAGTPAQRQSAYQAAIAQAWGLIQSNGPGQDADASGTRHQAAGRILESVVASLAATDQGPLASALRAYTRDYLAVGRSEANVAGVTPFSAPHVQELSGRQFRTATWSQLHTKARADLAFGAAVDASVIGTTLVVSTSDPAEAVLTRYPVEPLRSFFTSPRAADGSLTVTRAQIDGLVTAASTIGIDASGQYKTMVVDLSKAQEEYLAKTNPHAGDSPTQGFTLFSTTDHAKPPSPPSPEDVAKLKAAIAAAEAKRTELLGTLDKVESGITGAFSVLEELGKLGGATEFADDMANLGKAIETFYEKVKDYSEKAIDTAKSLAKLLDLGETGFKVLGGAIMTGGVVAAVFAALSIFGDSSNPNQAVLDQLKKLQEMISDLKQNMDKRFDRIDAGLNTIFSQMMDQFARVNYQLGILNGNIIDVQRGLTELQNDLNRLEQGLVTILQAGFRQELIGAITGALNYARVHAGTPISSSEFNTAENVFFAWATQHARNGANITDGSETIDAGEINHQLSFPLHFKLNYLRLFPFRRLGLPALFDQSLANPYVWAMAAESYAQLSEESPALAAGIVGRVQPIITEGQNIATALDHIANADLLMQIHVYYLNRFNAFRSAVSNAEQAFSGDTDKSLKGTSIFGDAQQLGSDSFLNRAQDLPFCTGSGTGNIDLNPWLTQHAGIVPFALASSLSDTHGQNPPALGSISACVLPRWEFVNRQPIPGSSKHKQTHRLRASVNIYFTPAGGAKAVILRHDARTDLVKVVLVPNAEPDPDPYLPAPTSVFPAHAAEIFLPGHDTIAFTPPAAQVDGIRTAIVNRYRGFQRRLYAKIAGDIGTTGTELAFAAEALNGAKKVWESFTVLGFPLSIEQNETLHGLLFGGDGMPAGKDDEPDGLLNDARDIYAAFARPDSELPAGDLLWMIESLAHERAYQLRQTLDQILVILQQAGVHEGRELVGHTLLRLQLLGQP